MLRDCIMIKNKEPYLNVVNLNYIVLRYKGT